MLRAQCSTTNFCSIYSIRLLCLSSLTIFSSHKKSPANRQVYQSIILTIVEIKFFLELEINSNWNFSIFYLQRTHFEYRMEFIERISMQKTNHHRRNECFDKMKWKKKKIRKTKWKMMIFLWLPLPFHISSNWIIEMSNEHSLETYIFLYSFTMVNHVIAARHMYLKCECIVDLVWALRQQQFVPLIDQNQQQSIYRHVTFFHSQNDLCTKTVCTIYAPVVYVSMVPFRKKEAETSEWEMGEM